jgi:hypothetical protein
VDDGRDLWVGLGYRVPLDAGLNILGFDQGAALLRLQVRYIVTVNS